MLSMILSANSSAKVMICAPSNAALDEIMDRLDKRGLIGGANIDIEDAMIRLGKIKQMSRKHLFKYTLDYQIDY